MIEVFTASWCQKCNQLKTYLDKKSIKYESVDIGENPFRARDLGIKALPSAFIEGKVHSGYDSIIERLEKE